MAQAYSRPGRPSKLTEQVEKDLLDSIRLGLPYTISCHWAGISYVTFRTWIKKGETQKSGEYTDFLYKLREAEAEAAVRMLSNIRRAGNEGAWQADAFILKARYPEIFGSGERENRTAGVNVHVQNLNVESKEEAREKIKGTIDELAERRRQVG